MLDKIDSNNKLTVTAGAGGTAAVETTTTRKQNATTEEAIAAARQAAANDAILVGISAGAALHAASVVAKENTGKRIVILLPDGGEKYLSTALFD